MPPLTAIEQKLLQHLGVLENAIFDGRPVMPAWRVMGKGGEWLITASSHPGQPEEFERLFGLVTRFMAWRKATSFIFGAEVALEDAPRRGESAIIALHISREAPDGVMRRFRRKRIGAHFNPPRWLTPDQLEREFFATLPDLVTGDIEPAEVAELKRIFGSDGELPAVKL